MFFLPPSAFLRFGFWTNKKKIQINLLKYDIFSSHLVVIEISSMDRVNWKKS